jgi:hypothetical protein
MGCCWCFKGFLKGKMAFEFEIQLYCRCFGNFWLGNCFGYLKKIGNKFCPSSWSPCFQNMAWMVISNKVKNAVVSYNGTDFI